MHGDVPVTVVLVDDHHVVREGTRLLLHSTPDIRVVAETGDAEDAVRLCAEHRPTVVLLDMRLRGASGVDVGRAIRSASPESRILVLTAYDYAQYVRAMLEVGAAGYLLKDASSRELIEAVRAVARGATVLGQAVTRRSGRDDAYIVSDLTERELDVLRLLSQGRTNADIACALGIGARTVEAHVASLMGKLGASTRTEAVARAVRLGLVDIDQA